MVLGAFVPKKDVHCQMSGSYLVLVPGRTILFLTLDTFLGFRKVSMIKDPVKAEYTGTRGYGDCPVHSKHPGGEGRG